MGGRVTKDQLDQELQDIVGLKKINTKPLALNHGNRVATVTDSCLGIIDTKISGITLNQIFPDGNFDNGVAGFIGVGATTSINTNGLNIIGTGATTNPYMYKTITPLKSGQKYYITAKVLVTNSDCASIVLGTNLSFLAQVAAPANGVFTRLSKIITATGDESVTVAQNYASGALANGKVCIVDDELGIMIFPLDGTPYINYTEAQLDSIIDKYIENSTSTDEIEISTSGKNLLDLNMIPKSGTYLSVVDIGMDFVRLKGTYFAEIPFKLKRNQAYTMGWEAMMISGASSASYRYVYKDGTYGPQTTYGLSTTTSATVDVKSVLIYLTASSPAEGIFSNIMFNEGSVLLPYERAKISKLKIKITDKKKFKLSRLNSGIENEINQVKGNVSAVKRNEVKIFASADIDQMDNTGNVVEVVLIKKPLDSKYYGVAGVFVDAALAYNVPNFTASGTIADTADHIGKVYNYGAFHLGLVVAKGKYTTIANARNALINTEMDYMLNQSVFIPSEKLDEYGIRCEGALSSHNDYTNIGITASLMPIVKVTYPGNIASSIDTLSQSVTNVANLVSEHEQRLVAGIKIANPVGLSFGANIITKTTAETAPLNIKFTPRHYVNLLGKDGNCEAVNKFTAYRVTATLDPANRMFGTNSIKMTLTDVYGHIYKTKVQLNMDDSKYYLVSAYLINGNATNLKIFAEGSNISSALMTSGAFKRTTIRLNPTQMAALTNVCFMITGSTGQFGCVDGIQVNEISETEYANDSEAALMARYPYVDSLGTSKNFNIKSSHADGTFEECVIEGDFFTGDTPELKDGQVIGSKLWKLKTLYGKDFDWQYVSDASGFKIIAIPAGSLNGVQAVNSENIYIKGNGKPLKGIGVFTAGDQFYSLSNGIQVSISDADSGFPDAFIPNHDEIKALANGWYAWTSDGTRITKWLSRVDIVTEPTVQSIDFVKRNVANGWDGDKLAHKLPTPQLINVDSDSYIVLLKGDAPVLKQGLNTIIFDTGIVLGEVAPFGFNTTNYLLNYSVVGGVWGDTRMQNKVEKFINGYKNGMVDFNKWISTLNSDAYGGIERISILLADFDTKATYTTDYIILRTIAPQIGAAEANYTEGLVDSVNALYELVETKQNQDVALDNTIAYSRLEKITDYGDWNARVIFGYVYVVRTIYFKTPKILPPLTTVDSYEIVTSTDGISSRTVTNDFVLDSIVADIGKVTIRYRTTVPQTITDIKANGAFGTVKITVYGG